MNKIDYDLLMDLLRKVALQAIRDDDDAFLELIILFRSSLKLKVQGDEND